VCFLLLLLVHSAGRLRCHLSGGGKPLLCLGRPACCLHHSLPARPSLLLADAARSALGVLVLSAHLLPPALAEQLVFSMGQCRMTESARNLAGAVASSKGAGSLSDPAVRWGHTGCCRAQGLWLRAAQSPAAGGHAHPD
jgi:hypothetical protein